MHGYAIFILGVLSMGGMHVVLGQSALERQLNSAENIRMRDLSRSSRIADSVYREARQSGNDTLAMDALRLLGWNAQVDGAYQRSIEYFQQVIDEAPEDYNMEKLGYAYGRLGKSYAEIGQYQKAMPLLLAYDSINAEVQSESVSIEPKLLLGELYEYMLNVEKAGAYFREAYEIAVKSGNRFSRIQALYYLLDFHVVRQKQQGFEEEMREYLTLMEQRNTDGTIDLRHASMLFMGMKPQEKSVFLKRRLSEMKATSTLLNRYFYVTELIKAEAALGRTEEALRIAKRELPHFLRQNNASIALSIHMLLSDLYAEQEQYREALMHTRRFAELRDSLHTINVARYVDSLEVVHRTAQKEIQLAEQEAMLTQQRQQRRILLIVLGAVIWFGAFIALFLWNRNRLTKRIAAQQAALQSQKIKQLEQDKKLLAMSSMIEGQEAERKRIAQDLHDGLGGLLSSVKAQLNLIQNQVAQLESMEVYQRANSMIDHASNELRRIAYNMMPSSLSRLGLKEAIEDLSDALRHNHGLKVDLQILGLNGRLEETREIMLYRILQELCNNIVKHAEASHVLIQINKASDEIFVIVEDDGKGVNLQGMSEAKGVGMRSLESRVRYLNGDLDIRSELGEGTCVTVHVPLSEDEISL